MPGKHSVLLLKIFRNKIFERMDMYSTYLHNKLKEHSSALSQSSHDTRGSNKQMICAAHTDIKVPDFSKYRRKSVKSPNVPSYCSEISRKIVPYIISGTAATVGMYGVKAEILRYVLFMAASAEVVAMAKIEIKLSDIPLGKSVTFKWRGKPLFIRHRTEEEIAVARAVPVSSLRDPEEDIKRCPNPAWLVILGVCTHLGCVPIADAGDFGPGGYYCPCHGSHFDAAGRARKGPAPTNLEIPVHSFLDDNTLIVG